MKATQSSQHHRVCRTCGRTFRAEGRYWNYCSYACVQASKDLTRTCERCGKSYQGPIWKTFCSSECRARTQVESSFRQFAEWIQDPSPKGPASVRHYLPYPPDLVALTQFALVIKEPITLEVARTFVASPSVSALSTYVVEKEDSFNAFVLSMGVIRGLGIEGPQSERDAEIGGRFVVDSASWARTLVLNRAGIHYHLADVRGVPEFKRTQDRLSRIADRLPRGNLIRCSNCGMVGDAGAHFKKRRVQGRWRSTQTCVYCPATRLS